MRWKTNSHLQYKLSLTDNNGNDIETNPPPPFTSLVVHCASQEDCFGYFLELPAGDYKVMVRPWNGVDQIMSNSVLSSQQTIIQKSENKISGKQSFVCLSCFSFTDYLNLMPSLTPYPSLTSSSLSLSDFKLLLYLRRKKLTVL